VVIGPVLRYAIPAFAGVLERVAWVDSGVGLDNLTGYPYGPLNPRLIEMVEASLGSLMNLGVRQFNVVHTHDLLGLATLERIRMLLAMPPYSTPSQADGKPMMQLELVIALQLDPTPARVAAALRALSLAQSRVVYIAINPSPILPVWHRLVEGASSMNDATSSTGAFDMMFVYSSHACASNPELAVLAGSLCIRPWVNETRRAAFRAAYEAWPDRGRVVDPQIDAMGWAVDVTDNASHGVWTAPAVIAADTTHYILSALNAFVARAGRKPRTTWEMANFLRHDEIDMLQRSSVRYEKVPLTLSPDEAAAMVRNPAVDGMTGTVVLAPSGTRFNTRLDTYGVFAGGELRHIATQGRLIVNRSDLYLRGAPYDKYLRTFVTNTRGSRIAVGTVVAVVVSASVVCLVGGLVLVWYLRSSRRKLAEADRLRAERALDAFAPTDVDATPVTVVVTDIVASTRLWARVPHHMGPAIDAHNALAVRLARHFHGYPTRTTGDGFVIVFANAADAVEFALTFQRLLAWRGAEAGSATARTFSVYGSGGEASHTATNVETHGTGTATSATSTGGWRGIAPPPGPLGRQLYGPSTDSLAATVTPRTSSGASALEAGVGLYLRGIAGQGIAGRHEMPSFSGRGSCPCEDSDSDAVALDSFHGLSSDSLRRAAMMPESLQIDLLLESVYAEIDADRDKRRARVTPPPHNVPDGNGVTEGPDVGSTDAAGAAGCATNARNASGSSATPDISTNVPGLRRSPDAKWPGLRVRIGIHAGFVKRAMDPTTRLPKYGGRVVDAATKVANAASAGQVFVTFAALRLAEAAAAAAGTDTSNAAANRRSDGGLEGSAGDSHAAIGNGISCTDRRTGDVSDTIETDAHTSASEETSSPPTIVVSSDAAVATQRANPNALGTASATCVGAEAHDRLAGACGGAATAKADDVLLAIPPTTKIPPRQPPVESAWADGNKHLFPNVCRKISLQLQVSNDALPIDDRYPQTAAAEGPTTVAFAGNGGCDWNAAGAARTSTAFAGGSDSIATSSSSASSSPDAHTMTFRFSEAVALRAAAIARPGGLISWPITLLVLPTGPPWPVAEVRMSPSSLGESTARALRAAILSAVGEDDINGGRRSKAAGAASAQSLLRPGPQTEPSATPRRDATNTNNDALGRPSSTTSEATLSVAEVDDAFPPGAAQRQSLQHENQGVVESLAASLEAVLAPLPQSERVALLRELAASWRLSPTRSGLSLPHASPADAAVAEAALRRELARRVVPLLCAP
jgi:hypothetical protein